MSLGLPPQRKKATAQRDAYKLTLKTLESLEGASPDEVAACAGAAAAAAADFIRSPETFQFDMLESPAVQQLQSDGQHGPVFALLSLLLAGDVQVGHSHGLQASGYAWIHVDGICHVAAGAGHNRCISGGGSLDAACKCLNCGWAQILANAADGPCRAGI